MKKSLSKQCVLSAVYVPAQNLEKNDFWDHLKHLNDVIDLPWCLMGDFKEMLISSDKVGGSPLTVSKTQRLSNFLTYRKGIDANVQGRIFAWKNFLQGRLIYKKLNRLIFREDCLQLFPNYLVTNDPFTCSDHSYVLLNTASIHPPMKGTTFKYQHSWASYQDTHILVLKKIEITLIWYSNVSPSP